MTINISAESRLSELEARINGRSNGRIRELRLSLRRGEIVIEGFAETYYAKQLAQHAVMEACDVPICANDLHVV
jgi:hypothetical protein